MILYLLIEFIAGAIRSLASLLPAWTFGIPKEVTVYFSYLNFFDRFLPISDFVVPALLLQVSLYAFAFGWRIIRFVLSLVRGAGV